MIDPADVDEDPHIVPVRQRPSIRTRIGRVLDAAGGIGSVDILSWQTTTQRRTLGSTS